MDIYGPTVSQDGAAATKVVTVVKSGKGAENPTAWRRLNSSRSRDRSVGSFCFLFLFFTHSLTHTSFPVINYFDLSVVRQRLLIAEKLNRRKRTREDLCVCTFSWGTWWVWLSSRGLKHILSQPQSSGLNVGSSHCCEPLTGSHLSAS